MDEQDFAARAQRWWQRHLGEPHDLCGKNLVTRKALRDSGGLPAKWNTGPDWLVPLQARQKFDHLVQAARVKHIRLFQPAAPGLFHAVNHEVQVGDAVGVG